MSYLIYLFDSQFLLGLILFGFSGICVWWIGFLYFEFLGFHGWIWVSNLNKWFRVGLNFWVSKFGFFELGFSFGERSFKGLVSVDNA